MVGRARSHDLVLEEIGRGVKGIVYLDVDLKLGREVALKILPPKLFADPGRKRRLIQEAKASAKLDPPHIGMVFEIDEADGTMWDNPTKSDEGRAQLLYAHHHRGAELGP